MDAFEIGREGSTQSGSILRTKLDPRYLVIQRFDATPRDESATTWGFPVRQDSKTRERFAPSQRQAFVRALRSLAAQA